MKDVFRILGLSTIKRIQYDSTLFMVIEVSVYPQAVWRAKTRTQKYALLELEILDIIKL